MTMGFREYIKNEFSQERRGLEYDRASDFYVSSWQRNQSPVPLMILRGFLCLGCLSIIVASGVISSSYMNLVMWPIFLTHWGLVVVTLSCGIGFYISCQAYFNGPIADTFGLPLCCKVYWVVYNISIPLALLITIIYWAFLLPDEFMEIPEHMQVPNMEAINTLDIFIHLVNSLVMLLILFTDRHPTRLVHIYQPLLFAIAYCIFNVIYYLAGGLDPFGNPWIYPILDWRSPGAAIVMVVITAIMLVILHILVALMVALRKRLSRKFRKSSESMSMHYY